MSRRQGFGDYNGGSTIIYPWKKRRRRKVRKFGNKLHAGRAVTMIPERSQEEEVAYECFKERMSEPTFTLIKAGATQSKK